jgi:tRNA/tmRNA/rRNA uracil-C5-methylase (TrmA/RlmC/RlmD family)
VNGSIIETFVGQSRALLGLRREETLLDLYCGYGLFALSLAGEVRRVIGAEMSAAAIAAAKANAEVRGARNCRFVRVDLTADAIPPLMESIRSPSAVILDPPRKGTGAGVIEAIAARRPSKVLHIFCNSDLIVPDLSRWTMGGYRAQRAVPLDMFPGTPEVETLVLLRPEDQGKISRGTS